MLINYDGYTGYRICIKRHSFSNWKGEDDWPSDQLRANSRAIYSTHTHTHTHTLPDLEYIILISLD